jgi:hypothetical protein
MDKGRERECQSSGRKIKSNDPTFSIKSFWVKERPESSFKKSFSKKS